MSADTSWRTVRPSKVRLISNLPFPWFPALVPANVPGEVEEFPPGLEAELEVGIGGEYPPPLTFRECVVPYRPPSPLSITEFRDGRG